MLHGTNYKVLLRPDKVKDDGRMPIYIRIIKHRKPAYFSIAENCHPNEWDENSGRLWENKPRISAKDRVDLSADKLRESQIKQANSKIHPQARRINAKIEDMLDTIQNGERELRDKKEGISVKKIREKVIDVKPSNRSFLIFYKNVMESSIRVKLAYNTYRVSLGTYNRLIQFQKGKDLLFEEITNDFLESYYIDFLNNNYRPETIRKHFKWIKLIWKEARKKKLVAGNPFEDFKVKAGDKIYKERLTKEEIGAIMKLDLDGRLNDVRNMFLFAFFHAGIRIGDLLMLKWKNTRNDRVVYKMKKNKKRPDLPLHPIGRSILKIYHKHAQEDSDYVFGMLENNIDETTDYFERQIQSKTAIVNINIKKIASLAGINKNLTTHVARHSYGNAALENNVNAFDLSYSMMHSKVDTTETYAGGINAKRQDKILKLVYKDFVKNK